MISDIIQAIELLLDTAQGLQAPEKRRRKVAKQILSLYLDICDVCDRGSEIILLLENQVDKDIAYTSPYDEGETVVQYKSIPYGVVEKINVQRKAIERLVERIETSSFTSVIKLHSPEFRGFCPIATHKGDFLGYVLSIIAKVKEVRQNQDEYDLFRVSVIGSSTLERQYKKEETYIRLNRK